VRIGLGPHEKMGVFAETIADHGTENQLEWLLSMAALQMTLLCIA